MIRKKIIKEESAISPIIGTILMVAITVIMAAIISSWSSGIKAPATPTTVGLDIQRQTMNQVQLTISSIDPPGTGITLITLTNASAATPGNGTQVQNWSVPVIGSTRAFNVSTYNEFVVVTVTYTDGTIKTLYSQRI